MTTYEPKKMTMEEVEHYYRAKKQKEEDTLNQAIDNVMALLESSMDKSNQQHIEKFNKMQKAMYTIIKPEYEISYKENGAGCIANRDMEAKMFIYGAFELKLWGLVARELTKLGWGC